MNEYSLKITGAAELPGQIDASKDVTIHAELSVYEVAKRDLQDGNFQIVYKSKIISAIEVEQGSTKMASKDPLRASQRLRRAIQDKGARLGVADTEQYYQDTINTFISSL